VEAAGVKCAATHIVAQFIAQKMRVDYFARSSFSLFIPAAGALMTRPSG
jgi:hypothetical protein